MEAGVLVAAVGGVLVLWRQLCQSRADLAQARVDAELWRQENQQLRPVWPGPVPPLGAHRRGIRGRAVTAQWADHTEIAELRRTSEPTVREQAHPLYHKAGLGGRASLSAFFLKDLLLPPSEADQKVDDVG